MQFDAEQAERAQELVKALSEPGTLDSLGIGSVRDGFANIFFPGTSTLHTRAIYALAIPWAYQEVARRRPKNSEQFTRWLRLTEAKTIEALKSGNPHNHRGIIGSTAGRETKRLPSVLYWNGLGVWGIRQQSPLGRGLSQAEVRSMILADPEAASTRLWDGVPEKPEGFPEAPLSALPTAEQSQFLLDKFSHTTAPLPGTKRSLLGQLASRPELAQLENLWDVEADDAQLRRAMFFAHGFSLVIQGARLRYLDLLFTARASHDPDTAYSTRERLGEVVAAWHDRMADQVVFTGEWIRQLPDMFGFLRSAGANVSIPTQVFVTEWCRNAVQDPGRAMSDPSLATYIKQREADLKRSAARLTNTSPLLNWTGELLGSDYLDYRWSHARDLINDCRLGMESVDA